MASAHKKAIGRQIAKLRKAKGWTQPQLAAVIPVTEVDAQQVSKWERGIHTPQKHLEQLAAALDVDEGDILAGDYEREKGETPNPFEEVNDNRLDALEAEVSELRDGLVVAVGLLLEQVEAEAEAAERRAEGQGPAPEPHEPERVRRLEAARQWAERQQRTQGDG